MAINVKATDSVDQLFDKGKAAKAASRELRHLSSDVKDRALNNLADALLANQEDVVKANEVDCVAGRAAGLGEALLDRLLLTPDRL